MEHDVLYISETTPGVPDERVLQAGHCRTARAADQRQGLPDARVPAAHDLHQYRAHADAARPLPRQRRTAARHGGPLRYPLAGGHDRDSAVRNPPPAACTCATAAGGEVTLPRRSPTVKEGAAPAS